MPITLAPRSGTFMSSCSTPWWAEYVSWHTEARTPRILFAAIARAHAATADEDAALGRPVANGRASRSAKSG